MLRSDRPSRQRNQHEKIQKEQNLQRDFERSLEVALLSYKDTLIHMRDLLLFDMDLRTITPTDIGAFESDLRRIIKEIEELRSKADIFRFLGSVDVVQEEIRSAINELLIASHMCKSETIDTEDTWRSFYTCLSNCRKHLSEALQQFLI